MRITSFCAQVFLWLIHPCLGKLLHLAKGHQGLATIQMTVQDGVVRETESAAQQSNDQRLHDWLRILSLCLALFAVRAEPAAQLLSDVTHAAYIWSFSAGIGPLSSESGEPSGRL